MKQLLFKNLLLWLILVMGSLNVLADNRTPSAKIQEQKRKIAEIERRIANEEQRIKNLRSGRAAKEEHIRVWARQIENRNQLIDETEKEADLLKEELHQTDSLLGGLSSSLTKNRAQYAEMVREAYRNYQHNNILTYLFASKDFVQVARKMTVLREIAMMRDHKLQEIEKESKEISTQKQKLVEREQSLNKVLEKLKRQKQNLQTDVRNAQYSIRQLSKKEKTALQRKVSQERQLSAAIDDLRKLSKGNKEGASFSSHTSGLRLPVVAGRVRRYMGNMAEITGSKGAKVITIYEGKVVEIRRNRITGKYEVYIAHGEYITTYANLGSITVEKGDKIKKYAQIGTIGSSVNMMTMEREYKMVFGVYPPNPKSHMKASDCFRK